MANSAFQKGGDITETTGTFASAKGSYNKRGKLFYNFSMANATPSMIQGDATTLAQIASELGITITLSTTRTIAIGGNWTVYYYTAGSWTTFLGNSSTQFITSITSA